jgi:hypothetical protein
MINSLIKNDNKQNKVPVQNLLDDIYLLPQWEKIKSFNISAKGFLFRHINLKLNMFRKFSSKNLLEKYSVRTKDDNVLASMDLKIYKDSVYIINLNIDAKKYFEPIAKKMVQVAVEKALYNTTEKEVVINIDSGLLVNHRIKKFLANNEFLKEEAQSNYEKELFGETYSLKIKNNSVWMQRIKQISFLINK